MRTHYTTMTKKMLKKWYTGEITSLNQKPQDSDEVSQTCVKIRLLKGYTLGDMNANLTEIIDIADISCDEYMLVAKANELCYLQENEIKTIINEREIEDTNKSHSKNNKKKGNKHYSIPMTRQALVLWKDDNDNSDASNDSNSSDTQQIEDENLEKNLESLFEEQQQQVCL